MPVVVLDAMHLPWDLRQLRMFSRLFSMHEGIHRVQGRAHTLIELPAVLRGMRLDQSLLRSTPHMTAHYFSDQLKKNKLMLAGSALLAQSGRWRELQQKLLQ